MKALSYVETPKGQLVMTAITVPCIDVLESKKAAVKKTTATAEFKELKASIAHYNKFVEKCHADKVRWSNPESVPDHIKEELVIKLAGISDKQEKLIQMEAQEISDNPVYLLPANSVFVTDSFEGAIREAQAKISEDTLVTVELSDGKLSAWAVVPNNIGKLYRLPDSLEWLMIEEPYQFFPDNAVFDDPGSDELERIEAARIKALDPESSAAEKQRHLEAAKHVLMRDILAAECEDTPEVIETAKNAAKEDYKALLEGLALIYG